MFVNFDGAFDSEEKARHLLSLVYRHPSAHVDHVPLVSITPASSRLLLDATGQVHAHVISVHFTEFYLAFNYRHSYTTHGHLQIGRLLRTRSIQSFLHRLSLPHGVLSLPSSAQSTSDARE